MAPLRSPPDYPVPGQGGTPGVGGTAWWRSRQRCGHAMLIPSVPAHICPLPAPWRPTALPAAVVIAIAGVEERRAEEGKAPMMPEEEGVAADKGPAAEAGAGEAGTEGGTARHRAAGKARSEGRMRRHRPAGEAGAAERSPAKVTAAKVSAAHPSHAAHVHAAATEMAA